MKIYCLEEFKTQFEKLLTKKNYKSLEADLADYLTGKTIEELAAGTRLNNSSEFPYIKKRLEGSGGFRIYYILLFKSDGIYFMFVHPKTGPMGAPNITDESKSFLYKKVLNAIKTNDLHQMKIVERKIEFIKLIPKN